MPSGRVDCDQYLDNWAGGLAIARLVRRTDPRPYHARQRLIRRMTRSVVIPSQGSITTSIRNLQTAGMSLSTFGSPSKKRWRLRKNVRPSWQIDQQEEYCSYSERRKSYWIDCC